MKVIVESVWTNNLSFGQDLATNQFVVSLLVATIIT